MVYLSLPLIQQGLLHPPTIRCSLPTLQTNFARLHPLHSCSIRFSNSIQNTSVGYRVLQCSSQHAVSVSQHPFMCGERERWIILLMDEMHTGLYNMLYNGTCLYTRLCILQRLSLVSLTWEISTITWQPTRNAYHTPLYPSGYISASADGEGFV